MRSLEESISNVEHYLNDISLANTCSLLEQEKQLAKQAALDLNKSGISVSAHEGQLLSFFVNSHKCLNFVEIGTLTGYSALWIAEALTKPAKLWTLENNKAHFEKAHNLLKVAENKLHETNKIQIEVLFGDARETLKLLSAKAPFDGIFIDGNKSAYLDYLIWAEANLRPGGIIIADNVFLSGAVFGQSIPHFSDKQAEVMKLFNTRISDPKLFATIFIPTAEGLSVSIKKEQ